MHGFSVLRKTTKIPIFCFSDELVEETKMKLDSKARDLFRSCVDEVKAFLSEEAYKEFRKLENIFRLF